MWVSLISVNSEQANKLRLMVNLVHHIWCTLVVPHPSIKRCKRWKNAQSLLKWERPTLQLSHGMCCCRVFHLRRFLTSFFIINLRSFLVVFVFYSPFKYVFKIGAYTSFNMYTFKNCYMMTECVSPWYSRTGWLGKFACTKSKVMSCVLCVCEREREGEKERLGVLCSTSTHRQLQQKDTASWQTTGTPRSPHSGCRTLRKPCPEQDNTHKKPQLDKQDRFYIYIYCNQGRIFLPQPSEQEWNMWKPMSVKTRQIHM